MGIAEQSATCVAAGLAKEGKLPVFGTYGVFASGRNLDQIRTTVCYGNYNVFIAGAHGGVSVGPDGATHQALEELFQMCGLPNMHVEVPCDAVETERATSHLLFNVSGPKYLRFAREATPVVTDEKTPWAFGQANVVRFRAETPDFKDAFEHTLASSYEHEGEILAIIACGPAVPEAMRAAWILRFEYGIESRVLNLHTMKPLDVGAVVTAARECGAVLTVEEHQVGGKNDRLLVHRKGATRAFGPGHPELPQRYKKIGQPVIIPGDMGRASYLLAGTREAMEQSWGSTCHGAGRLMSRTQALKNTRGRSIARELGDKGVLVLSHTADTLREEVPEAYKDVDHVVGIVHMAGLSRKVARMKPLGVVKG
jgi:transketolase C-terminal domain/subunit